MTGIPAQDRPLGRWLVFGAVSLAFFFLNMATFTSLGVVLFTMEGELHWDITAALASFTFLGFACGLSSPLPGMTMRSWGSRPTVCIGAALLAIGFALAAIGHSLATFYVAMTFLGIGYSFVGNVPAVYLIAGWFERRAARVIGAYMMLGAAGAAVGPPMVEAIVRHAGWRGHWQAMAWIAAAIGIISFAFVRDPKVSEVERKAGNLRRAAVSAPFLLITAVMTGTMFCVTTNSSVAVNHLVKLGSDPRQAAFVLGAIGAIATLVKAGSGWLCELMRPSVITAIGLILQGLGMLLFAFAASTSLQYASAVAFGVGWGLSYVAGTVVLLEYFGRDVGSQLLSFVWFIVSIAGLGPIAAGIIADTYGTFAPIYVIYAAMMALLAVPIFLMRRPAHPAMTDEAAAHAAATLVPNVNAI